MTHMKLNLLSKGYRVITPNYKHIIIILDVNKFERKSEYASMITFFCPWKKNLRGCEFMQSVNNMLIDGGRIPQFSCWFKM